MRTYVSPRAELILFQDDIVLSQASSNTCRCYLDIGVKFDYSDPESSCWTDSEDATAYDVHNAPL